MTKARARARAKAKAGKKSRKTAGESGQSGHSTRPGQFDPGPGSIKSPRARPGGPGFSASRKGAARSR